jgi:hypothetical protein
MSPPPAGLPAHRLPKPLRTLVSVVGAGEYGY